MQEVAAIQKRDNFYAWRKNLLVQLLHLLVYGRKRLVRIGALAQEDDSLHNIVAVQYGSVHAPNGFADMPQTNLRALRNDSNVFRANRSSVLRLDQCLFDVAYVRKQPQSAHIDLLQPGLEETSASVGIIVRE